jgi:hypothetical protein
MASFVLSYGQPRKPSKQLACIRRNALPFSESTPCIWQVKAMQDGFTADTAHGSTLHVVRSSGQEGGAGDYKGVEGGDGTGSTLDRKESPDGNRGHQRSGSSESRRASMAQSQDRGDDFESVTQTDGVGPMARVRGGIQGVPDGAGTDTECSTEDSRERRPHHRGKARLVLPSVEARAYGTVPGSTPLSCPRHPAQVAVLVSTQPSTGPPRYWSEKDPQGGLLQRPGEADPGADSTRTTTQQSPPVAHGPRDTGTTADPRRSGGEVASGTILIAVPSTPAPGSTGDDASMPDAPQHSVGQTGGRPHIISSSSSSSGGRGLAFQMPFLISGQGIWLIAQCF